MISIVCICTLTLLKGLKHYPSTAVAKCMDCGKENVTDILRQNVSGAACVEPVSCELPVLWS